MDYASLLHLLKASSKQTVLKICDESATKLNRLASLDEVESVAKSLEITNEEAELLIRNLKLLIKKCIWEEPDASNIKNIFPDDFHSNLRGLLCKIFLSRMNDWKAEVLNDQVGLPQLKDFTWNTKQSFSHPPVCEVQFTTTEEKQINMELSKETLSTMLDSLTKIRDQISSVAK